MRNLLITMFAVASFGNASATELKISESQVLGFDDTINIVKDSLLSRIKIRALDSSGTFTLSEKTYDSVNDRIKEKIKLKSIARVYVKHYQQDLRVKDGQVTVTINALVQIDDDRNKPQSELESVAEKDATIAGLKFQNSLLQAQPGSLTNAAKFLEESKTSQEIIKFPHEEFSAVTLLPGELFNLELATSRSRRGSTENFKTSYREMWANYSNELRPVVKSVYREDDYSYINLDIALPLGIFDTVLRQIAGPAASNKNWHRFSDLVDAQSNGARHIIENSQIVGNNPVSLLIDVGQSRVKIPFFGIGEESFLGDLFFPFENQKGNVRISNLIPKNKRMAIGFYTPKQRDISYRLIEGHAIVKMRIADSDVLSAPDIKARFVTVDAPIK